MKREAWNHPKIKLLCRDLKLPLCYVNGILESLWLVTSASLPAGDIGRWPNEEIAAAIDYPGDADELIRWLVKRRFLDEIPEEDGRLYVHDWHEHCDQATRRKLARRDRPFANGKTSRYLAVTSQQLVTTRPPEPEPEPEPEPVNTKTTTAAKTTGLCGPVPLLKEPPPMPPPIVFSEYPETRQKICGRFPAADDVLVGDVAQKSVQAWLSVDSPKIPEPTDRLIAEAVDVAATSNPKQTSAGLFLRTVPAVITNWAKCGRGTNGKLPQPRINPALIVPYDPIAMLKAETEVAR